jgi:hypothetical protein
MLLAFALGSLPRAQPGGSLLLNSWWLLVLVSLAPLVGLGLMIVLMVLLVYNSDLLSRALGAGIAGKRKKPRKRTSLIQYILAGGIWIAALVFLMSRPGGLLGEHPIQVANSNTLDKSGNHVVATAPPIVQNVNSLGSFFQTNWFYAAFYGLLIVCSVIVARSIIFSWQETKAHLLQLKETARAEAIASVGDAFRILNIEPGSDPRLRIINCYQRMALAAQQQGANITSDQTARELEAAIHDMLGIKGPSMRDLTNLFEEARYSLHPITEDDATRAQQYLLSIAQEMNFTISI